MVQEIRKSISAGGSVEGFYGPDTSLPMRNISIFELKPWLSNRLEVSNQSAVFRVASHRINRCDLSSKQCQPRCAVCYDPRTVGRWERIGHHSPRPWTGKANSPSCKKQKKTIRRLSSTSNPISQSTLLGALAFHSFALTLHPYSDVFG